MTSEFDPQTTPVECFTDIYHDSEKLGRVSVESLQRDVHDIEQLRKSMLNTYFAILLMFDQRNGTTFAKRCHIEQSLIPPSPGYVARLRRFLEQCREGRTTNPTASPGPHDQAEEAPLMPSDEKPLTRYDWGPRGVEPWDEGAYYSRDDVDEALAAKDDRIAELAKKLAEARAEMAKKLTDADFDAPEDSTWAHSLGQGMEEPEVTPSEQFWAVQRKREEEFWRDSAPAVNAYLREKLEAAEGAIREMSQPNPDPPVTRRELLEVLRSMLRVTDNSTIGGGPRRVVVPPDSSMLLRLERGEDARGEE